MSTVKLFNTSAEQLRDVHTNSPLTSGMVKILEQDSVADQVLCIILVTLQMYSLVDIQI